MKIFERYRQKTCVGIIFWPTRYMCNSYEGGYYTHIVSVSFPVQNDDDAIAFWSIFCH